MWVFSFGKYLSEVKRFASGPKVVLFCYIFHIWTIQECFFVIKIDFSNNKYISNNCNVVIRNLLCDPDCACSFRVTRYNVEYLSLVHIRNQQTLPGAFIIVSRPLEPIVFSKLTHYFYRVPRIVCTLHRQPCKFIDTHQGTILFDLSLPRVGTHFGRNFWSTCWLTHG